MRRAFLALTFVLGFTFVPFQPPAQAAAAWDCNAYVTTSSGAYRYCRESCDYGPYYVWVKLVRYDTGTSGLVYKTKGGGWQIPGNGVAAMVLWDGDVWDLYSKATKAVDGCS